MAPMTADKLASLNEKIIELALKQAEELAAYLKDTCSVEPAAAASITHPIASAGCPQGSEQSLARDEALSRALASMLQNAKASAAASAPDDAFDYHPMLPHSTRTMTVHYVRAGRGKPLALNVDAE